MNYFEPEDAGELLVWYSKRARDLTVKLKALKKELLLFFLKLR